MSSVPDYRHVPQLLFATGLYNLHTEDGQAAFTDAVVATLNGIDENWRHLIKKPGQTAVHDHGEDSVLYLLPDNTALAVDFIGGAGGANPQPGWMVGTHVYTHADAHDPDDHGIGASAPPPPSHLPYPGDPVWDAVGVTLFTDYREANQALNPQMGRWFGRTIWDATAGDATGTVLTVDASIAKHRSEWRNILGLPPLP